MVLSKIKIILFMQVYNTVFSSVILGLEAKFIKKGQALISELARSKNFECFFSV